MLGEEKKLEANFGACLEIAVWICEEGEKDSGGGMGKHVQEKGILTVWVNWHTGHSWDRELSIQDGPECTITNS